MAGPVTRRLDAGHVEEARCGGGADEEVLVVEHGPHARELGDHVALADARDEATCLPEDTGVGPGVDVARSSRSSTSSAVGPIMIMPS